MSGTDPEASLWSEFLQLLETCAEPVGALAQIHDLLGRHQAALKGDALLRYFLGADPTGFTVNEAQRDFPATARAYQNNLVGAGEYLSSIRGILEEAITFDTGETCPQCHADHLRCYTTPAQQELYQVCQTCYFSRDEGGVALARADSWVPAETALLKRKGVL